MRNFFFRLRRTTLFMFLLIMPIGIQLDPEHPNEFTLSAHGGGGQVISVLRDCDGDVTSSEKSKFVDVAGSMQVSHRFDNGIITAFGVRGGYLESNGQFPTSTIEYPDHVYGSREESVIYRYFNPYIAIESRSVGIGLGFMSEKIPMTFGDSSDELPMSAHFRLGNFEKTNFQISLNEDLPLASGAGYFKTGLSYPLGSRLRLFTGLSFGFYEGAGMVQQIVVPLSRRFDLDFSTRLGSTEGHFAGGFALGLRLHHPFGTSVSP